jgi:cobalt-zinc-cadmium resistance protein CzcA
MLEKIIETSLKYRLLVIVTFTLIALLGIRAFLTLNIDSFPDVTPVQVNIVTESPGLATEEVEKLITFPIESALAGLPKVEMIRSISMFGLSVVTVFFHDGTDIYFARRLVMERLPEAAERIPEGYGTPIMGPNTTGLGQVFQYYLEGEDNQYDLMDLRTLQDWTVRLIIRTAPGVDDVLSFGGYEKQYQVLIDPQRLIKYGLTLSQVMEAVASNNRSVGGQYVVRNQEEYLVRGMGWVYSTEDIANIILAERNGTPILVKDVARVIEGPALRRGAVTLNGKEVVAGIVLMRTGENTKKVIDNVKEKLTLADKALPDGVKIKTYYDQSELVEKAVDTARRALLEGAVLVTIVLLLFLGEFRSSVVVVIAVPLCMLMAFIIMELYDLSANLMSLGGLAIGIGLMVDGAVVMVENSFRFLQEKQEKGSSKVSIILDAAREVASPIAFAILIIITVFLPLFSLTGIEGKMFKPMAFSVSFAMLGSLILTMTFIPALASLVLKYKGEKEALIVRILKGLYLPLLRFCLRHKLLVILGAIVLLVTALSVFPFLGREFVPILEEGNIQLRVTSIPSTSIEHSIEVAKQVERVVLQFPEVILALSKIGRAEKGDPEDVYNIETYIKLKPYSQWPRGKTKTDLIEEMREQLEREIPGVLFNFSQLIQMRVDELISGIRAMLAVKIYGEDIGILSRLAGEVKEILEGVEGTKDLQVESLTGKPQLMIEINRQALARYGINADEVLQVVRAGIGGEPVSVLIDGVKRFEIPVWFQQSFRSDIETIRNIPLHTAKGYLVPLERVARVSFSPGLARIRRENLQRFIVVQCNVEGKDIGSFVEEAQKRIQKEINLPPGYFMDWGGQFENQRRAMKRLSIIVPLTILLIFILLYTAFNSLKYALLIILNVPFSAIGGIYALFLTGLNLSVPASVGFITVFGVAMLNGVVLVSFINELREQGTSLMEAVLEGARLRLRPVLMTASVATFGLLPLLLSRGVGAEVQKPLATVVVGGLTTSTFLTLVIIPTVYLLMEKKGGSIQ